MKINTADKMRKIYPDENITDGLKDFTALVGEKNAFQFIIRSETAFINAEIRIN